MQQMNATALQRAAFQAHGYFWGTYVYVHELSWRFQSLHWCDAACMSRAILTHVTVYFSIFTFCVQASKSIRSCALMTLRCVVTMIIIMGRYCMEITSVSPNAKQPDRLTG